MEHSFEDFLSFTVSQKEISLILAQDEEELETFTQQLTQQNYRQAVDISDLFKHITHPSKLYFVTKNCIQKDIYDFTIQYPTGQIEIYDTFNLKSQIVTPFYKDVSLLLIMSKQTLHNSQLANFNILNHVGLTYQR